MSARDNRVGSKHLSHFPIAFVSSWLGRALVFIHLAAVAGYGQGRAPQPDPLALESGNGAWGDRHNGRFLNPVLPGDFSDLDAIRIEDDFYAISSTMQYSPGMVILHSRDLVNWEIAGHVVVDITTLDQELGSERMNREGRGIWAGSIRWHNNAFWVYFGTPDGGIYVSSASKATGPWSVPKAVIAAAGWDDPCPFWNDDGRGYLVATKFSADKDGQKYRIHLFEMTADSAGIIAASDRVLHQSRGSEANKMYKVDGVYLHYFSEVRPEGRVAMMERSKSLAGPWETRQLNHVHAAVDGEPNQGGLIQLRNGSWWFLSHQGKGDWNGRAGVLLPVTWVGGWPVLGRVGEDGIGEMVWGGVKPIASNASAKLFVSDSLQGQGLSPAWEWRFQPSAEAWSLTGKSLRMQALTPLRAGGDFRAVRNVLTQRSARAEEAEVTVRLELGGLADEQEAGLAHFAKTACRIAVVRSGDVRRLYRADQAIRTPGPIVTGQSVVLRSNWTANGLARFSYSIDGGSFKDLGEPCRLIWAAYRGDRIGLYTDNASQNKGYADFSNFEYRVK